MEGKVQSARLFESNFWERFTHVHHTTPFFIFAPIIVTSLFYGNLTHEFSYISLTSYFILGILQWTFAEYLLHRYFFHFESKSPVGQKIVYLLHGIHHDHPNEADRLVMPPVTSIPIATALFGIYFGFFKFSGMIMFAGFLTGYLYYEFVHYSVHNHKKKTLWTEEQRKNHLRHHFQDPSNRFGVTSPLWDLIFRTYR